MSIALIIINVVIPSLGMIAGLSVSFTVPMSFTLLLWQIFAHPFTFHKTDIYYYWTKLLYIIWCLCNCFWQVVVIGFIFVIISTLVSPPEIIVEFFVAFTLLIIFALILWHLKNFKFSKIILIFTLWCLCSCFWMTNPVQSLKLFLQVFSLIFISLIINKNIDHLKIYIPKINISIFIGTIIAMILFLIEYSTNGIITNNFKALFSTNSLNKFHLYNLDRGCAILALTSWLVIYITNNSRKYILAVAYYALVFYLLSISESLASFVGFSLGAIAFIFVRINPSFFISFIKCSIIIGSLAMPVIAFKIEPRALADGYSLPLSAKHRLFIWHYASKKALEKPIFGHGFGSSRYFEINDNQYIDYNGEKWSPLPIHPHNNVIQILLETGAVGLLLFLTLIYQFFNKVKINIRKAEINSNYAAAFVACFVNYYTIGMISFNIWQLWWVYIGTWLILMFKWQDKALTNEANRRYVKD